MTVMRLEYTQSNLDLIIQGQSTTCYNKSSFELTLELNSIINVIINRHLN